MDQKRDNWNPEALQRENQNLQRVNMKLMQENKGIKETANEIFAAFGFLLQMSGGGMVKISKHVLDAYKNQVTFSIEDGDEDTRVYKTTRKVVIKMPKPHIVKG